MLVLRRFLLCLFVSLRLMMFMSFPFASGLMNVFATVKICLTSMSMTFRTNILALKALMFTSLPFLLSSLLLSIGPMKSLLLPFLASSLSRKIMIGVMLMFSRSEVERTFWLDWLDDEYLKKMSVVSGLPQGKLVRLAISGLYFKFVELGVIDSVFSDN